MPQTKLVEAFERGAVGGGPRAPVQRIDTHLSHIFLSGDRAFKMKRAVKMPFVDFTTVAQRGAACRAELAVNAGPGRKLYLAASPILQEGGGFRLGRDDEGADARVVDWVVVMRRFAQDDQFDRLAAAGRLSVALIQNTAEMIAASHLAASNCEGGSAQDWRRLLDTLRKTCADGAARAGAGSRWRLLLDRLDAALEARLPLIEARRAAGKVRRTHGDLHLRNLCLFEGEVCAFDAIEFDEALSCTDVLYDLAFLLMDLRHAGLDAHANAALNRYWDAAAEDEAALELLPFFIGVRAAVRMAVALEAGAVDEADAYRVLGERLSQEDNRFVVALGGLSGTGKSAVARSLAPHLGGPAGARILRTDVLRKQGLNISTDATADPKAYGLAQREHVYHVLMEHGLAVGRGCDVILDATFQEAATRRWAEEAFAGRLSAFWLSAPLDVRLERVAARAKEASDAGVDVAAAQTEPSDLPANWARIDATAPVSQVIDAILIRLAR